MSEDAVPLLDINRASQFQLEHGLRISSARAAAICRRRSILGSFQSVQDLRAIAGVTPKFLERIGHLVTCQPLHDTGNDLVIVAASADLAADEDSLMEMPPSCAAAINPSALPPPVAADDASAPSTASSGYLQELVSSMTKRKSTVGSSLSPNKKPCLAESTASSPLASANVPRICEADDDDVVMCPHQPPPQSPSPSPLTTASASSTTSPPPPADLHPWVDTYLGWSGQQRLAALDQLLEVSESSQVRHVLHVIQPRFQRDFISLLPRELALHVLAFLPAGDLLRAARTCRSWRQLAEDNLLWREKCRELQLDDMQELIEVRRRQTVRDWFSWSPTSSSTATPTAASSSDSTAVELSAAESSLWKQTYIRRMKAEANWRTRPLPEPKVLSGHDDHVITCLQFSGNRVVSGSDDNTLKVWSASSGRCLRTLIGHTGGVWSSQMNDTVVISGSTDRTLKIWNVETGQCLHTLYGHSSTVRCMHLHDSKVVSGSRDATLRVWDVASGECEHVLVGHVAAVRCVQYDGRLVVSGAYDYMVKVWNPDTEQCLHTLQGHNNRVYSLQFDGVHVVSGSLDTSIRVWDVETGQCRHTLMGHQSLTSGMELKNNILVSGNADSTVKVWDITSGQCLQTLSGQNKHQSAVTCLQFQNNFVVTSSDDGTVKLWDVKTGEFVRNLVTLGSGGSGGVVWRIRASRTKLVCAVGSRNGTEETKLLVLDFEPES